MDLLVLSLVLTCVSCKCSQVAHFKIKLYLCRLTSSSKQKDWFVETSFTTRQFSSQQFVDSHWESLIFALFQARFGDFAIPQDFSQGPRKMCQ